MRLNDIFTVCSLIWDEIMSWHAYTHGFYCCAKSHSSSKMPLLSHLYLVVNQYSISNISICMLTNTLIYMISKRGWLMLIYAHKYILKCKNRYHIFSLNLFYMIPIKVAIPTKPFYFIRSFFHLKLFFYFMMAFSIFC